MVPTSGLFIATDGDDGDQLGQGLLLPHPLREWDNKTGRVASSIPALIALGLDK